MEYQASESFARACDEADPLRAFRDEFIFPKAAGGGEVLYFVGNSLGLQPKTARRYVNDELDAWADNAVTGHHKGKFPWYPYHEFLTEPMARVVGAQPNEVVVMNSLTVNLHLMLVSFYRPTKERYKILIEEGAFPSDQYAVASQVKFRGFDPETAIVETASPVEYLEREGNKVALIMLGNVNFRTGEAFDTAAITRVAHQHGCVVGFDFAHGAGNLLLKLHDWDVDFAVWCGYKYLNSGPGGLAGCFVHERHAHGAFPRFEGWWGHDKVNRFQMARVFAGMQGAEGWQLSNPPILPMATLRASLEIFDRATMARLRDKSEQLTGYLEFMLDRIPTMDLLTPRDPKRRAAHLSYAVKKGDAKSLVEKLETAGVVCDFRSPNVIRLAPVPLYNSFTDVYQFARLLEKYA